MRLAELALFVSTVLALGSTAARSGTVQETPHLAAQRMLEAHGGLTAWQRLSTLRVEREHHFLGWEAPIRFQIHAEYATQRHYQRWQDPPGEVFWDGERAWSAGWRLADRFLPRFVTSIGFYLINLPWYAQEPEARLLTVEQRSEGVVSNQTEFIVLSVEFEADMVRKPRGYLGERDHFEIYLDPQSYLIRAVHQHRTYAGQLDAASASPESMEISEIYVPEEYIDLNGLKLPGKYSVYSATGEKTAEGRFFDYAADVPFDQSNMIISHARDIVFDRSSSYIRENLPASDWP